MIRWADMTREVWLSTFPSRPMTTALKSLAGLSEPGILGMAGMLGRDGIGTLPKRRVGAGFGVGSGAGFWGPWFASP